MIEMAPMWVQIPQVCDRTAAEVRRGFLLEEEEKNRRVHRRYPSRCLERTMVQLAGRCRSMFIKVCSVRGKPHAPPCDQPTSALHGFPIYRLERMRSVHGVSWGTHASTRAHFGLRFWTARRLEVHRRLEETVCAIEDTWWLIPTP